MTCTGVIVGYCWTGSTTIDTSPAMQSRIETTAAKIGRSMKKRENMARLAAHRELDASRLVVVAAAGDVHGALSWMRSAGMPSATSASRTTIARRLASSTLAA